MPLFPPPQVTPAPLEDWEYNLNFIMQLNKSTLDVRCDNFIQGFNKFWETLEIAQAICDSEGNEAYKFFEDSYTEQLAIKELRPEWEFMTPPFPTVVNEDGTVTISE